MKIETNNKSDGIGDEFYIGMSSDGKFVCSNKKYTEEEIRDLFFTMAFKAQNIIEWYNC